MAQKKKTSNKSKQKQKQKQYQRQSVVVNLAAPVKRRSASKKSSGGGGSGGSQPPFAPQFIQSIPLKYSPQTMFDQTSILTEDSRNRIFQSEIRNGIRLLNEERTAVNTNTQEEWMRQQEAIINKKNTPPVVQQPVVQQPVVQQPVNAEEVRYDNIRKDMARAQRNINKKTLRSDLLKNQYIDEERGLLTPLPVPVDNSIPDINQTGVRGEIYRVPNTTQTIRVPSIRRITARNPPPMMPEPVDNAIIMNAPAAAMEEPDAEMEEEGERINYNRHFIEQDNGLWLCKTCRNPEKSMQRGNRKKHLKSVKHLKDKTAPRPPFRV